MLKAITGMSKTAGKTAGKGLMPTKTAKVTKFAKPSGLGKAIGSKAGMKKYK